MTASLAYLLGSSNSLIWSWFFWVYVHPLASIAWFVFCLFTLVISIEIHQLQKNTEVNTEVASEAKSRYKTIGDSKDVVDVIVIPPPQLTNPSPKTPQRKILSLTTSFNTANTAQLPNRID